MKTPTAPSFIAGDSVFLADPAIAAAATTLVTLAHRRDWLAARWDPCSPDVLEVWPGPLAPTRTLQRVTVHAGRNPHPLARAATAGLTHSLAVLACLVHPPRSYRVDLTPATATAAAPSALYRFLDTGTR